MPRLSTTLIRQARAIDPFLPSLLASGRDLRTAQNELRWLREHVDKVAKARRKKGDALEKGALLGDLVRQRARGRPLQYILGTEWFGELEIKCREGVLIPRQDTAASISHLARLIRSAQNLPSELRVLDLCTGSGCIPLLFRHEFHTACPDHALRTLGVDISLEALKLAAHNIQRQRKNKSWVDKGLTEFIQADVLIDPFSDQVVGPPPLKAALNRHRKRPQFWDVLVSNPPYISQEGYWKTTTRSVRGFEPKLALVPPDSTTETDVEPGDAFYGPLLTIARDVEAKIVLMEVADIDQALRVARRAKALGLFAGVEIWRDQPDASERTAPTSTSDDHTNDIPIIGAGNARSVICWLGAGTEWLGKQTEQEAVNARDSETAPIDESKLSPSFETRIFDR